MHGFRHKRLVRASRPSPTGGSFTAINTYAVVKSGIKNVDSSGNSPPIPSQKVLAAAKSKHVKSSNTASYQSVVEENEHLRETNESLLEENGVNRELILSCYADFGKEPPTHLLDRLASIDASRHQWTGSSHNGSHPDDMHTTDNDNGSQQ